MYDFVDFGGKDTPPAYLPKNVPFSSGGMANFTFGTSTVADTLQSLRVANTIIADYGLDRAFAAVEGLLRAHNTITATLVDDFCEVTTDRQRRYGSPDTMTMQDLDEVGLPAAQKISPGVTVGFPMRRKGIGLQWTYDYFQQATTAELAGQIQALITADTRMIQREIKRSFIKNSVLNAKYTFTDALVDGVSLSVKMLAQNDGDALPVGPNGETFTTAHQHYMASGTGNGDTITTGLGTGAAWTLSGASAGQITQMTLDANIMIQNTLEHSNDGELCIYINQAQEGGWRSLNGFSAFFDPRTLPTITTTNAIGSLDVLSIYNRRIGYFGGAEIWVKPWVPSNYAICFLKNSIMGKPLCLRVPQGPKSANGMMADPVTGAPSLGGGDLRIVSTMPGYPLYAQAATRTFGVGVWNKIGATVMYTNGTSYTNATIS